MGPEVNGPGMEICPFVSADGEYLFFEAAAQPRSYTQSSSPPPSRPADGTPITYSMIMEIAAQLGANGMESYWIDANIIDRLRQSVLGE